MSLMSAPSSGSLSREEMLAIWLKEKREKKESIKKQSTGSRASSESGRWSVDTTQQSLENSERVGKEGDDSRDPFSTPKEKFTIPQLKNISVAYRRTQNSAKRSGNSTFSQRTPTPTPDTSRVLPSQNQSKKSSSKVQSDVKKNQKRRTPLSSVSRNRMSSLKERTRPPLSRTTENYENRQSPDMLERIEILSSAAKQRSGQQSEEPTCRISDSKYSCERNKSFPPVHSKNRCMSESISKAERKGGRDMVKTANTLSNSASPPFLPIIIPVSPASNISSVSRSVSPVRIEIQSSNNRAVDAPALSEAERLVGNVNESLSKECSNNFPQSPLYPLELKSATEEIKPCRAVCPSHIDNMKSHTMADLKDLGGIINSDLDPPSLLFLDGGGDDQNLAIKHKRRNRRRKTVAVFLPEPSLPAAEDSDAFADQEIEGNYTTIQCSPLSSFQAEMVERDADNNKDLEQTKCIPKNGGTAEEECNTSVSDEDLQVFRRAPGVTVACEIESPSLSPDSGKVEYNNSEVRSFVPVTIAKHGDKTILEDIPEIVKNHGVTDIANDSCCECSEEIESLRSQLVCLMVEKHCIQTKLHKVRYSYENRVSPFQDLFEELKTLRSENELLKKETCASKASVDKVVAGLQQQMVVGLTAAVTKTQKLEKDLKEAKARNEELEIELQNCS